MDVTSVLFGVLLGLFFMGGVAWVISTIRRRFREINDQVDFNFNVTQEIQEESQRNLDSRIDEIYKEIDDRLNEIYRDLDSRQDKHINTYHNN